MYDGPFGSGAPVLLGGTLLPRGPRLLAHDALPGYKRCELVVLACRPAPPTAAAWLAGRGSLAGAEDAQQLHEVDVELVTGVSL